MSNKYIVGYGFDNFSLTLDKFERHIIKEIKRIVSETAEMMVTQMRALAPVDDGNLRRSIDVIYAQGGLTAIITVGAEYAIYVEYGTGIYNQEGNGRTTPWVYFKDGRYYYTKGIRSQPFFFPGIDVGLKHFRLEMNKIG